MEFLKKTGCLIGSSLLLAALPPLTAAAQDPVCPFLYETDGVPDSYIRLLEDTQDYEVQPGDSLWKIAEGLWNDGGRYPDLYADNRSQIRNPDLIYPGMILQAAGSAYLKKQGPPTAFSTPQYCFDSPPGSWPVGTTQSGEAWANLVLLGDGISDIACLVQDKEPATVQALLDWESCTLQIQNYVAEQYPDTVSGLSFERYRSVKQEDIYLYSYTYAIDMEPYGEEGELRIDVCVGIKLTQHLQAQFVGFGYGYDMHGAVRYVTASFEEKPDGYEDKSVSVNGSNMQITPVSEWSVHGLYNAFPWVDEYFTAILREFTGASDRDPEEKERLLQQLHAVEIGPLE
mgnify:CR=1 FL=1